MSGRLWMYSDQLDDEDLAFARHSFFRYSEGIAYYRLTEKIITRIAREANAIYKIDGKMVLVRRDLFEAYLRKQYRITGRGPGLEDTDEGSK
ncbi:MAG: DUF6462 family protein [Lachnospiraceae bacterium]|jgi:hypothetical protein|nr:DUF6462 family protein [Lachnospiraceae bacterium]MCI1327961.1 DUF6462 family protein [Lachnospiraceae bacterium]